MAVRLLVDPAVSALVAPPARRALKSQLVRALHAAHCPTAIFSVRLADDAVLWQLNKAYADEDHATDVLSFSQTETQPGAARITPPGPTLLGDVVISVETAARQANARATTLEAELLHLAVHGLCHLLGFDHATKRQEQKMFALEATIREAALR